MQDLDPGDPAAPPSSNTTSDEIQARSDARALDRALFHGMAWTAVWRWAAQIFSWAVMLYAARILSPDDFGLAAMCYVPIGLARMVEDLGLDAVLVQDRSLTGDQIARLGGLAMAVGASLMILFAVLAVPIAGFFREPAIAAMIAVLSTVLILDAAQIVPRAKLQRDLAFKTLAWIDGIHVIGTASALAIFASLDFSAWSLIANTLCGSLLVTIVLLILRPIRLAWPRQMRSIARSVLAGSQILASRIAWYGYSRLDQTFIGRMIGKAELGAYSMAITFATFPVQEITSLLSKVVPGVFSTVQKRPQELRRYYLMLTEAVSYLTLPCATGVALVADDLVMLAIGPQWEAAILPLRILCAYAAFNSAQALLGHILLWTGRFKVNLWLNVFALVVLTISYWIGVRWGLEGVALALLIGFPISTIPGFYIVGKILDMPIRSWFLALLPATAACAGMAIAVILTRQNLGSEMPHGPRLAVLASVGASTYAVLMYAIYRKRITEIVNAIRSARAA